MKMEDSSLSALPHSTRGKTLVDHESRLDEMRLDEMRINMLKHQELCLIRLWKSPGYMLTLSWGKTWYQGHRCGCSQRLRIGLGIKVLKTFPFRV
jgi:hypothetical protein